MILKSVCLCDKRCIFKNNCSKILEIFNKLSFFVLSWCISWWGICKCENNSQLMAMISYFLSHTNVCIISGDWPEWHVLAIVLDWSMHYHLVSNINISELIANCLFCQIFLCSTQTHLKMYPVSFPCGLLFDPIYNIFGPKCCFADSSLSLFRQHFETGVFCPFLVATTMH